MPPDGQFLTDQIFFLAYFVEGSLITISTQSDVILTTGSREDV